MSATYMTKQYTSVLNRKNKQYLKTASYVQKTWPDSVKGHSEAANFSECRNFLYVSSATNKSTQKIL